AEEEIRARLDPHRVLGNLGIPSAVEELSIGIRIETLDPAFVRFPLVAALPIDVSLVGETTRKESQELFPTAHGLRRRPARRRRRGFLIGPPLSYACCCSS